MKKFYLKIFILFIPFILYFMFVALIDPYNKLNYFNFIDSIIKFNYSRQINYTLWALLRFNENPCPNIILGDSRITPISADKLKSVYNGQIVNLAYGAGDIEEEINTFWYCASKIKLENVYIQVNINIYNDANLRDRVKGTINLINSPVLYFSNINVLEASFRCFFSKINNNIESLEKPSNMTKEEFWKYQLEYSAPREYVNFIYPVHFKNEFVKISDYCRNNNINLYFIIFPEHTDLQNLIPVYNLTDIYNQFVSDLKSIGNTYDFNFKNDFTSDYENFADPYHLNKKAIEIFVDNVWSRTTPPDSQIVKYYKK
jgi:hypothetical protein